MADAALKPGAQLASTVSAAKVVVIKAPAGGSPVIAISGTPLVAADSLGAPTEDGGPRNGTLIGKRYVDEGQTVELLCTASGSGELTLDGAPMTLKSAKPLPASD